MPRTKTISEKYQRSKVLKNGFYKNWVKEGRAFWVNRVTGDFLRFDYSDKVWEIGIREYERLRNGYRSLLYVTVFRGADWKYYADKYNDSSCRNYA